MKSVVTMSCSVLFLALGQVGWAGPVSAGGVPPTPFQEDASYVQNIFESDEVQTALKKAGRILSVTPDATATSGTFVIQTEKCTLKAKAWMKFFPGSPIGTPGVDILELNEDCPQQ